MAASKKADGHRLSPRDLRAIAKVLADPRRFQIFREIAANANTSCSHLLESCPITAATMSHHLKELEAAGLIEITRTGKFIQASVCRERWNAYLAELNSI